MALQSTPEIWWPGQPPVFSTPSFTSTGIDAAGEMVAWVGQVKTPNRGSKNITKVGLLAGAITSAGGSNMRLSLQNVSAAAGQPLRPDETQDQTVDFLASAPTANAWYQTGALSATRAVTHGEFLAVVLEFETFAGADLFNVRNIGISAFGAGFTQFVHKTGGSWAAVNVQNNVILEFDDGTFGTLTGGWPASDLTLITVNTGTTPDEVALQFTVPIACKVEGMWLSHSIGAAARDFEIILYEGTTAQETLSVDGDWVNVNTQATRQFYFVDPPTLATGTTYYMAYKPTTASNNFVQTFDVSAAGHFQAHAGGSAWSYATRVDGGSWSNTATRRIFGGLLLSSLDDGAGSGGGVTPLGNGLHPIGTGVGA